MVAFLDHQVERLSPAGLDVGAGRVEVVVVRHDVARLAQHAEEDALGGAALVCGDDVLEAGDLLHRLFEAVERAAAGVALIPAHHAGPLRRRHRAGAAVGQQIDQHVVGAQQEQVVAGLLQHLGAVLVGREVDRLDGFDFERFDDGFEGVGHGSYR